MVVLISMQTVIALRNPAAVYCEALGYKYSNGFCIFPDGNRIDAWKFLLGEAGEEYSYCAKHGYELRIIEDPNQCLVFLSNRCAGCLLPNGSVVEVTKLMGLSFEETVCGDGRCGFPENYKTCPQDCPSGSMDMYCDGVPDGICDPDCEKLKKFDPDCSPKNNLWIYIILIAVSVFAIIVYYETKTKSKMNFS